ncbi:hypothetical protein Q4E40_02510 [Pontibacter sp. BT731]|uniref:hypothetical protein n=1 Tax=Pontibacter coccineus TaxID=3063328 RepID=UPI0026E42498|nr:hypothetical protein [Pontibacter sp. BT731]MDO6388984.1 hypothetical protein [Pontibacter sp. BT731]
MKYAIYILLAFALFTSCRSSQIVNKPLEVNAPDSLPDPASANGWVFVRTSVEGGIYVPPVAPKKVKTVVKDRSRIKDAIVAYDGATVTNDESLTKDKSKDKPKVKADIIGDGNSQTKADSSKFDWIKYVCVAVIVLVLLYVFYPFIARFRR